MDGFTQTGIEGLLDEAVLLRPDYLGLILGITLHINGRLSWRLCQGVGV